MCKKIKKQKTKTVVLHLKNMSTDRHKNNIFNFLNLRYRIFCGCNFHTKSLFFKITLRNFKKTMYSLLLFFLPTSLIIKKKLLHFFFW